jgi:AcrR family transcriptional regulator
MKNAQVAQRKPLTRQLLIEQALALADAHGLEAVSIRRLAKELGVTPMALYWHVRNKNELLDGMVDRIYAAFDGTIDAAAPWQAQFRSLMNQLIAVFRTHPAAAALLQSRDTYSESSLRVNEMALDILHRAGLSPFEAARVMRHAVAMATGVAGDAAMFSGRTPAADREEATRGSPGSFAAQPAQRYPLEATRVLQQQEDVERGSPSEVALQPEARYPRIVEAAAAIRERSDPDAYCTFAVDLLLAGIEALAARKGPALG